MVRSLHIFALLLMLVVAVTHAILPSEVYWNSALPNIPMPNALKKLLNPDRKELDVSRGGSGAGGNTQVYVYSGTEEQVKTDPKATFFFLEDKLHPGTKMNLHFTPTTYTSTFLERQASNSIPFSSNKLPEILARLAIQAGSDLAKTVANTIKECEEPAIHGEVKSCATSLESMVDFATSTLKSKDLLVSSTVLGEAEKLQQQYTVLNGVQRLGNEEGIGALACHVRPYPYAVFYCHKTSMTRVYAVPMVAEDGAKVEAVAVCHLDTSKWNPKHLAFLVLKVKPGSTTICHILPRDHVVWTIRK